ncbi:EAL domain-containing protein [Floridanema evergladense]|uniref:EAL domain-containing protein n=1 Tax=Floridaenema evergladense BLCC-F167 TaxID=3153639 RepID=A0ABV4WIE8_9CYAN
MEISLSDSNNILRAVIEGTTDAIFIKDIQGKYVFVNSATAKILGKPIEEIIGKDDTELFNLETARKIMEIDRRIMSIGQSETVEEVIPINNKTQIYLATKNVCRNSQGEIIGLIGISRDITERKRSEEKLQLYAYYDPITGLPNRTLFMKLLAETIKLKNNNRDSLFAVLFLSLDRFQRVKFSLGHHLADRLMIAATERIETALQNHHFLLFNADLESSLIFENQSLQEATLDRNSTFNNAECKKSIVAQVGLDELAILLTNLSESNDATYLAEQIYQALSYPFDLDGQEVFMSTSIGIAFSDVGYEQPDDYLRAADTAMHQIKQLSKSRYAVFEPTWQTQAVERLQLETDLRRAIERQEFHVYYQPIISIKTDKLIGFEALVRWHHPNKGWVSPVEFIPVAEETGLISLIDRYVLREACRQMVIWEQQFPHKFPLTISVNLSAAQLAQLGLIERIDQILKETGIKREHLKIEITESSLTGNHASEIAMLQQLKNLGIQLSIDDFGTGYSSLARLHQLPIDTLKIDRSFVNQMGSDSESLEIIRTIISLAHILEMDVIAEGVETSEQLLQLQALECEYSQGFLFSRPVDRQTAERLISACSSLASEYPNN